MSSPKSPKPSATSFGSHHAYFIEGEKESVKKEIENFLLEDSGFEVQANPDYLFLEYKNMSVEDARNLREMHMSAAISDGGKRVFVIYFESAESDAQNTLLKTFEEPNETSRFFVIAPSVNILLPTLKSRFEVVVSKGYPSQTQSSPLTVEIDSKDFLDAPYGKRLKIIKKIIEDLTKEKIIKRDVLNFVEGLREELRERVIKNKGSTAPLSSVLRALTYISDRSSSIKMLLEHIAITS